MVSLDNNYTEYIRFKVMDKDTGSKDDLVGYYAIRFDNIRSGI